MTEPGFFKKLSMNIVTLFRLLLGVDKRKHKRFIAKAGVRAKCIYNKSGQRIEFPVDIIDISEGGANFDAGVVKILPGVELELSIELPKKGKAVLLAGEVMRTYRRHNEAIYFSAIKFKDIAGVLVREALDSIRK